MFVQRFNNLNIFDCSSIICCVFFVYYSVFAIGSLQKKNLIRSLMFHYPSASISSNKLKCLLKICLIFFSCFLFVTFHSLFPFHSFHCFCFGFQQKKVRFVLGHALHLQLTLYDNFDYLSKKKKSREKEKTDDRKVKSKIKKKNQKNK